MTANCEKVISDLFAAWTRLNVEEAQFVNLFYR
jgi:hypothetical protein